MLAWLAIEIFNSKHQNKYFIHESFRIDINCKSPYYSIMTIVKFKIDSDLTDNAQQRIIKWANVRWTNVIHVSTEILYNFVLGMIFCARNNTTEKIKNEI